MEKVEKPTVDNNVYNHESSSFRTSVGTSMEGVLAKAMKYNEVANSFDKVSQGVQFLAENYTPKELAMLVIHQTQAVNRMAETFLELKNNSNEKR